MEVHKPQHMLQMQQAQVLGGPKAPLSATANAADTSGNDGSTSITANDFLSLLVAEMKNQDPTADTDPNAYINQLVGVNSLQQLIQINQDLGGASTSNSTSNSNARSSGADATAIGSQPVPDASTTAAVSAASRLATSLGQAPHGHPRLHQPAL